MDSVTYSKLKNKADIVQKTSTINNFNPDDDELIADVLLNADGTTTTNTTYFLTGYIEVEQGDILLISQDKSVPHIPSIRGYAFYDENKALINAESATSGLNSSTVYDYEIDTRYAVTRDVDVDCYYVRLCLRTLAIPSMMIEIVNSSYNPRKNDYVAYTGTTKLTQDVSINLEDAYKKSPWKEKKSVWNGDSITAEYIPYSGETAIGYNSFVAEYFDMQFLNEAIGGSTISVDQNDTTSRDPIVLRYSTMPPGDLIIIAGGINDWFYAHTALGTMADRTNFTFYGALHNLCLGLKEKYIGKQLLFLTPIKRSQDPITEPDGVNTNGDTLKDYTDTIIEVCAYYGIPVLDMFRECQLNPHIVSYKTAYQPDGAHPNTAGHQYMAERVIGYLKQLN